MQGYTKKQLIEKYSPGSRLLRNSSLAFLFGGSIAVIGEILRLAYLSLGADEELSGTLVSISLIGLAAIITGIGLFDRLARYSGAGTLVPITGFSNAVVSEAMDSSSEGYVLGVGAKIFTVAGPVILYGITAGAIYGVIYYVISLIFGG